jgi:hypothetical protein
MERSKRFRRTGHLFAFFASFRRDGCELAETEQLITKSIEMNERIGRRKGVARAFGLLGEFQQVQGDDAKSEQSLLRATKSLAW